MSTQKVTKEFPLIPEDIVKELEALFRKPVSTSLSLSLDQLRYMQGQAHVVEFLRTKFDRQQNNLIPE